MSPLKHGEIYLVTPPFIHRDAFYAVCLTPFMRINTSNLLYKAEYFFVQNKIKTRA